MKIEEIIKIELKGLVRNQQTYILEWMNQSQNIQKMVEKAESEDIIRMVSQLLLSEESSIN